MVVRAARLGFGQALAAGWLVLALSLIAAPLEAAEPAKADLPLKRVVLFNSGVGFFEHAGEIEGDRTIEMHFDADVINDLLKSMVVQDFGEGHVTAVSYDSREPIAKQLKSFSIDLGRNPTVADLLRQLRGQRLQVSTPNPIDGVVVGLERRRVPVKDTMEEIDVLNLKAATGLRSIPLSNIVEFRLLDEKLDKEFQAALAVLAEAHNNDKKSVALTFTGKGVRKVRVGYIQESPVWKTSYRLVLDDKGAPLLQGWAVVENTTEHDWQNVNVTLVSGKPISFVMDLYEPLFVNRPAVVPEMFASLSPHSYDQDLSNPADAVASDTVMRINGKAVRLTGRGPMQSGAGLGGFGGGGFQGGMQNGMNNGFGNNANAVPQKAPPPGDAAPGTTALDLKKGVSSVATADEVGELFRYAIDAPVTIAHNRSAMLPIVNESVKGDRVSIFDPEVQTKHPLAGLRLRNTTKLHLMQGPITVFDGGEYAGDAQIEDIPPGASRLISYALDLNVEVVRKSESPSDALTLVKIVHGSVHAATKHVRRSEYLVKNSSDRAKRVLVIQPIDTDWQLTASENIVEKSRGSYRFAVDVPANKTANLSVEETRTSQQITALGTAVDTQAMVNFRSSTAASAKVKASLKDLGDRLEAKADLATQHSRLQGQIADIDHEQSRIRQNMVQINHNSDLYTRYEKMFGEQEDSIIEIRKQLKALTTQEDKARKELAEFVEHLDVE